jgi:hypothetical protein
MQEQQPTEIPVTPEVPKPRRRLSPQTKKMLGVLRQLRKGSAILKACEVAGMAPSTFYRWRKKNPRMSDLCDAIIGVRINVVEDSLFMAATVDRNISAIIFFLTNRAGDKWADRRALVNNTNIFSPKTEAVKNGEGDSVESVLERIDRFRADLIPPGDKE